MKRIRWAVSAAVGILAAVGLGVVNAGPAVADPGSWSSYKVSPLKVANGTWGCGSTTPITSGIEAQACMVRAADGIHVQGALIVHNRRTTNYAAEAAGELYRARYWDCRRSEVGKTSWSVCYGPTYVSASEQHIAEAGVNGIYLFALGAGV